MKGFYEKSREENTELHIRRRGTHDFKAHFHGNLEIFIIKSGAYRITVNEHEYTLTDGQIAVIDSYNIHSYEGLRGAGDDCIIIVPYRYLRAWSEVRRGMAMGSPVIEDGELACELLDIADRHLCEGVSVRRREAAIKLLLAMLLERLEWVEDHSRSEVSLIREILAYIHENYRNNVTRGGLARALGYTEAHISRVFHRYIRTGISAYVNELRLEYVDRLREAGDRRSVTDLIYEAGFGSQQTYYRAKSAHRGGEF